MKKLSIIYLFLCVLPCLYTTAQETIEFVGDFPSSSAVQIASIGARPQAISTSTNSQFAFQAPSMYLEIDEKTSTGLIKGRVRVEANTTSGGNKIANYALSITCVPERPHIVILDTIAPQEYMRDIVIGFASFGASYYEVEFEDLDFGGIANQIVYQKDYNTKLLEGFYVGGNYLITVKARNEFGPSIADSLYLYNAFVESTQLSPNLNTKKLRDNSIIEYLDNCEIDVFSPNEQYKYANWGIDLFFEENGKIERINYISNQKTENNSPYKFNFKDLLSTFGLPKFPNEISKDNYYFWEANDKGYTLAEIRFEGITKDNRLIKNSINVLLKLAPSKPEFEIINFKYYPDPNSDWESIDLRFRGIQPINTPPIFNQIYRWWLDGVGGVNATINPDDVITNNNETITTIHSLRSYNGFGISDWTNFDPMEYYKTGSNEINKVDDIGISIYPNPAIDQITIKTNKSLESCNAIIYNMVGNEMKRLSINNVTIDISDLSNGTYILRIILANNQTQVLRFIKISN